jgi:hypothetical protein
MKEIQLTQGKVALVDDEDFEHLNNVKWRAQKDKDSNYYALYKGGMMHRLIMNVSDIRIQIDHIDGNGLNNQRFNLRPCSASQNAMNRRKLKNTSSKYKGVHKRIRVTKKKTHNYWVSGIKVLGKLIFLGYFPFTKDGEIQAALKYNEAALKYQKEFAKINIINP